MTDFIILSIVTAISLLILSYIPFLGIEIDSPIKALIAGFVFGLLNAFVRPIIALFSLPLTFITFGLFSWVINMIIFGLAAWLVPGFRLRNKILSSILGAIALAIINSLLLQVIGALI
ncbi:MAG: phage holin family protein [Leptolyngbyaceae cyanobacterium SM1_3_5]|nr:phage holin family protein [Leptolyngbyaceae cyanobacterium SM1_3_5]